MKINYKMESVLIALIVVLCTILLVKLLYKLRSILPWRVNCWFCNNNFWVKYLCRNSWTCPKCEQYNGFTKDGDYNKSVITTNEHMPKSPKLFASSPPKNGLCKMCNINQQLKVAQLANFVPMNEKNFEVEIEGFRVQLEKAYRLCTSCKKVLLMKLHKEKQTLLGTKLLESRSPEKRNVVLLERKNAVLKSFINNTSMIISGVLVLMVTFECYRNIQKHKKIYNTVANVAEIVSSIVERLMSIVKMKTISTFPSVENYFIDVNDIIAKDVLHIGSFFNNTEMDNINLLTQKSLGGFVCLIQIVGHVWNVNKLKHVIVIDIMWSVFVIMSIAHHFVAMDATILSFMKLVNILAVLVVYKNVRTKTVKTALKVPITPNKMKNLSNGKINPLIDEDDSPSLDTDDDVSLSKFGLHNFTESSNETLSPLNTSLINGRSFTPRNESLWTKPSHNSVFSVNTALSKSPSSVSDTVFVKPSFNKYQNLTKDDSDSELDESISSLCIGSPKKAKSNKSTVFSLRKFTATPNFVAPTPLNRARPLISPSKLCHNTSWVAGGYWGTEGERHIFNINGSRSSSQSSGFESQASSMNQRNLFSQPPSREESVCGDPERNAMALDRFQNSNMSNYGCYQAPNNFTRVTSPVYPQMQYNSHVQIPQPRFAQQNVPQNVFAQQQQCVQNNMFKAPYGSSLIKLPQNSFTSH